MSVSGSRLLVVNPGTAQSRNPVDGEVGATASTYTYRLMRPVYNVTRMSLSGVDLPNVFTSIIAGYNDTINFWYNATAFSATVTAQTYSTGASFATELASVMNTAATAGADIGVTYSTATGKLTITGTVNGVALATQTTTPFFANVIGFMPNLGDAAGPGVGATSLDTGILDLSGPAYIKLHVVGETTDAGFERACDSFSCASYIVSLVGAGFLEFVEWRVRSDFAQQHSIKKQTLQQVRVRWTLPNGDEAPFNGAQHTIYIETV